MFDENIAQSLVSAYFEGAISAGLEWCNLPDLDLDEVTVGDVVHAGFKVLYRRASLREYNDVHPMDREPNLLQLRSRVPEGGSTPLEQIALALLDEWFDWWAEDVLDRWETLLYKSKPVPGWMWQMVCLLPESDRRTQLLADFEAHNRPTLEDYAGWYVFGSQFSNFEQLNRPLIAISLAHYLPDLVARFSFEELLTPKRVLELYSQGKLTQDEAIDYCACYPYLGIPPTPLCESFQDTPREGSSFDIHTGGKDVVTSEFYCKFLDRLGAFNAKKKQNPTDYRVISRPLVP
ncbi:hypothetical protein BK816_08485 [Boudabousia tangfeifanii]|uniref:Uncharacterized protein n=1 Tax=Boudabousia tangfeifanii TaxID=1912795 RepID=A0A1D9MM92_9ACTO|nr:hypothetical protein [Boudabousia tangfeifanii]AOZ73309.1 hypothetical protein BK816_08485 [Boudabousia tangfeifanii]